MINGIIAVLLQRDKVTAPELVMNFKVYGMTIQRIFAKLVFQ